MGCARRLPLNANGKLDRKALPAPVVEHREFRAPVTAVQEIVADVFGQVLGVERAGLDDDFFALGGNSLLATQVIARASSALDTVISIRVLFENPTVEGFAERAESHAGAGRRAALVAQLRPDHIPLSFGQQRMFLLNQLDPDAATYNIPFAVRLEGAINVEAFAAAVDDVVARHEVLRTSYPLVDGTPIQEIHPVGSSLIPHLITEDVTADSAFARAQTIVSRGFDVSAQLPFRAHLLSTGSAHILVVVVHHIAGDGFSAGPFMRDVALAYVARLGGNEPGWQPLPIQYADFSLWQREVLGAEGDPQSLISQQIGFWRRALADVPVQLDLPADRPRPVVSTYRGAMHRFSIDAEVVSKLEAISRANGATLFMTIHAALAVLLARLSGTSDIAIGTPVAGRGEAALDDLVGMFINTLVLRTAVDGGTEFSDLIRSVRTADIAAFGNADVPFERLVEVLNPERSTGRNPLFQVLLAFQNLGTNRIDLPGSSISVLPVETHISKFDLEFEFVPTSDGVLVANITYALDLFDEARIAGFAEQFTGVLAAVIADSRVAVGDIPLVSDAETRAITARSQTAHGLVDSLLTDGFDRQVARTPNATAVVFEGSSLTYAEFDARVTALAHHLIGVGVGPESLVGLAIRRSLDLVVGMYAIVRAGGAWVPIDPDHPADRIAHVLDTAQPACVLTTARDEFVVDTETLIQIDTVDLSAYPATRPDVEISPDNTVYAIFTSGSTGRPKGVAITHRSIVNQMEWMQAEYQLTHADVYLQKTATTFDVSLWGYWMPLRVGATLVVATPEGHRDPEYLANVIAAQGVTVTDFVPSMFAVFAEQAHSAQLNTLREVFLIGEALPPRTVAAWHRISDATVENLYGPTEATVSATYQLAGGHGQSVPIGLPQWNVGVYVVDSRLRPVPDGVAGELYLSGIQLARGYVNRPDLTSDRFVANPFEPGKRMYRTGDLVRWTSVDGEPVLDYIGRTDFQVKFRGQRIELGDIESALIDQPEVSQSVVIVRNDGLGEMLAAYVVPAAGTTADPEALRAAIAETLPTYMIPGAIVVMEAFPLNPAGKLDRKQLPVPVVAVREFRTPVTTLQHIVAGVFGDVLGVEQVGLDDDFFALGGNSLLAARVAAELRRQSDKGVQLQWLFTSRTVEELAARIESGVGEDSSSLKPILGLRATGDLEPLFLFHPMSGLGWPYIPLAELIDHRRPVYAVQTAAILDPTFAPQSMDDIAARYVEEIRNVQPHGPYHLAGWSLGGVIAHAVATQLQAAGETVAGLAILDSGIEADREVFRAEIGDMLTMIGAENVENSLDAELSIPEAERLMQAWGMAETALKGEHVSRMFNVALQSFDFMRTYRPSIFHGDATFVVATGDGDPVAVKEQRWVPYVDGQLSIEHVDSIHLEMLVGDSLHRVAEIVNRWLAS